MIATLQTDEWVIETDNKDLIIDVSIVGEDAWVMLGHKYFTKAFSKKFIEILDSVYDLEATKPLLWESIYLDHIDELDLYIWKYSKKVIYEFDSLVDLRKYDESYWSDTGSKILKEIAKQLEVKLERSNQIKRMDKQLAFASMFKERLINIFTIKKSS